MQVLSSSSPDYFQVTMLLFNSAGDNTSKVRLVWNQTSGQVGVASVNTEGRITKVTQVNSWTRYMNQFFDNPYHISPIPHSVTQELS